MAVCGSHHPQFPLVHCGKPRGHRGGHLAAVEWNGVHAEQPLPKKMVEEKTPTAAPAEEEKETEKDEEEDPAQQTFARFLNRKK